MTVAAPAQQQFWFLDTLVQIRVPADTGADRLSVLEHWAPARQGPPMHIHHSEDEIWHVLEGAMRIRGAGREQRLEAGESALGPKGIAHTYRTLMPTRFLTICAGNSFESLVRALGQPAPELRVPPMAPPPDAAAVAALSAICSRYQIEIAGAPLAD